MWLSPFYYLLDLLVLYLELFCFSYYSFFTFVSFQQNIKTFANDRGYPLNKYKSAWHQNIYIILCDLLLWCLVRNIALFFCRKFPMVKINQHSRINVSSLKVKKLHIFWHIPIIQNNIFFHVYATAFHWVPCKGMRHRMICRCGGVSGVWPKHQLIL